MVNKYYKQAVEKISIYCKKKYSIVKSTNLYTIEVHHYCVWLASNHWTITQMLSISFLLPPERIYKFFFCLKSMEN